MSLRFTCGGKRTSELGSDAEEWTLDWHGAYFAVQNDNFADLSPGPGRVYRSGWRTAARSSLAATSRSADLGVRCARGL